MSDQLIVSASGIRGRVGSALHPELAARYGAAFGAQLSARRDEGPARGRVLVARDSRPSGALLADAVSSGLRAAGWDVRDAGVVPTPTALLAVQDDEAARGGVVVTASHNPPDWNGLKMAGEDGLFLPPEEIEAVHRLCEEGPKYAPWDRIGGGGELPGAAEHHLERILELPILEPERIRERGFRVALDAGGGAGGPLVSRLLKRLGCEVIGLGLKPDGRFRRDPEPVPESLGELAEAVRERGADVGMALDPDADRLALVDEGGRPVGEDWTLALAAEYVLARRPGPVVTTLSSSRVIADAVERAGGRIHLAPVGEVRVARRMLEVEAVVGGEGNGGVMLPDLHLTRDAPVAAALLLGALVRSGESLGRIVDGRPGYQIVKRKARRPGPEELEELYGALEGAEEAARSDRQDGLRLDWPDEGRWLHVRPSGTEPVVRIVAEAREPGRAERMAEEAVGILERMASSEG